MRANVELILDRTYATRFRLQMSFWTEEIAKR